MAFVVEMKCRKYKILIALVVVVVVDDIAIMKAFRHCFEMFSEP